MQRISHGAIAKKSLVDVALYASTLSPEAIKRKPKRHIVAVATALVVVVCLVVLSSRAVSTIHRHGGTPRSASSLELHYEKYSSLETSGGNDANGVDATVVRQRAVESAEETRGDDARAGGDAVVAPPMQATVQGVEVGSKAEQDMRHGEFGGGGATNSSQVRVENETIAALDEDADSREGREQGSAGLQWPTVLPNQGRSEEGDKGVQIDSGARSQYYGVIQRQHQEWLTLRATEFHLTLTALPAVARLERVGSEKKDGRVTLEGDAAGEAVGRDAGATTSRGDDRVSNPPQGDAETGSPEHMVSVEERVSRIEEGVKLWNTTYAPPIEPVRRLELIEKWSGNAARRTSSEKNGDGQTEVDAGRILYVVSSFDRGERLGPSFKEDKLDFILLMMDEMREACEAGFSPRVHLIAAWEISAAEEFVRDRLFCRRTGDYVPYSLEEHPHSIGNDLSIKHRVFMKTRLEDFDVFIQVEDDIILTLSHIMLFLEESEILDTRRRTEGAQFPCNSAVPGFIRVEHLRGEGAAIAQSSSGEGWLEWEVILSRFRPVKLDNAGVYLTLGKSRVLIYGGNNQGMWIATREQLRKLSMKKTCGYLDFDETSGKGHVETYSGSLQMFSPMCGFQKVFPARQFESFLVHHRANNKLGKRGESLPGVSISLLRSWVEQFLRDESLLVTVWNPPQIGGEIIHI